MQLTLSNREIAQNQTWIVAAMWLECSFCGYLAQGVNLTDIAVPCARCKKGGRPRTIFPGTAGSRLLGMISHFYASALERHDDRAEVLARHLSEQLGRDIEPISAVEMALSVHRSRTNSDGSKTEFEHLLEMIRDNVGLHSTNEARKTFTTLVQYSDTTEEHQITVLLAASLLEQMFRNLLIRLHLRSSMNWESGQKAIRDLASNGKREKEFAKLARVSLQEAISASNVSSFHADWQQIRELRNKFMHGTPYAIRASDADKAFELAKNTFAVFAYLHNTFCSSDDQTHGSNAL